MSLTWWQNQPSIVIYACVRICPLFLHDCNNKRFLTIISCSGNVQSKFCYQCSVYTLGYQSPVMVSIWATVGLGLHLLPVSGCSHYCLAAQVEEERCNGEPHWLRKSRRLLTSYCQQQIKDLTCRSLSIGILEWKFCCSLCLTSTLLCWSGRMAVHFQPELSSCWKCRNENQKMTVWDCLFWESVC